MNWSLLLLLSCGDDNQLADIDTQQSTSGFQYPFYGEPLQDLRLLRRVSLDLRGALPSDSDRQRIQNDPDALEQIIDEYMEDPLYEERLIILFNEWFQTIVDEYNVNFYDYHLSSSVDFYFNRSVGEEALRLMAWVATNDKPWTELVTTEYTVANDLLLNIWPLEAIADGDLGNGWKLARYTDGRPIGGIVMTNGLWWRYYTTPNNYSRTRAMVLTDLFLCEDYLQRPINFTAPSLLDRDDLNEVIRTDAACIGCHNTLDPIASAMFGFWWFDLYDTAEMTVYHPEREYLGEYYLGQSPTWFGTPMQGPADLGPMIAADGRYVECTVERMSELLWHRKTKVEDFETLEVMRQDFQSNGLRLNSLIKSILLSDDYQVGYLQDDADEEAEESLKTLRLLTADQIESSIYQLTGFKWSFMGYNMLQNDTIGYRILLGGIDGVNVKAPARNPSLTQQLTLKRLSQAAADHLIDNDWDASMEQKRLFKDYDLQSITADSPEFEELLRYLHLHLYSKEATADRLVIDKQNWSTIAQSSTNKQAWKSLLSVMIRDPAFWTY